MAAFPERVDRVVDRRCAPPSIAKETGRQMHLA
jgi:hypothetical protein